MASLKSRLVRPLHHAALVSGWSGWCGRRKPVRRILMLHGVGPGDEISAETLDEGLAWIAERFRIVSLGELIQGLADGREPSGEIALTFDDGLKCQLEQAYPVLARHNVPATFFVCPGLVHSGHWLWNHEARARLQRLTPAQLAGLAVNWGTRLTGADQIVEWMKTLDPVRRATLEEGIRRATPNFTPSHAERARFDPLTWGDLAGLDPRLVTIGSHTLMHPILPTLDDAALDQELRESRAVLERRLGRVVDLFCYPNGSNDARVRAAAARVYRAAVTTEYGSVGTADNLLRLPRIPMPARLSLLAWRMHRPLA